jgi:hypothetical protein
MSFPEIQLPATVLTKPFLSMEPDAVDSQAAERVVRGARSAASMSGAAVTETDPAPPVLRRTYSYHCTSRADVGALRGFYRARAARREAFWFIDWQTDLKIDPYWAFVFGQFWLWTKPPALSDPAETARSYTLSLWPLGRFYRTLAITRGLAWAIWNVGAVEQDNPVGSGLERLRLDLIDQSSFHGGPTLPLASSDAPYTLARGYRPLWLRYGRFDADTLPMEFHASDEAIAELTILDLPLETPA